jgi:hypothetical protein
MFMNIALPSGFESGIQKCTDKKDFDEMMEIAHGKTDSNFYS